MCLAYHLETSHTAEEGDRDFDIRLLGFPFYDLWDSEAVFCLVAGSTGTRARLGGCMVTKSL